MKHMTNSRSKHTLPKPHQSSTKVSTLSKKKVIPMSNSKLETHTNKYIKRVGTKNTSRKTVTWRKSVKYVERPTKPRSVTLHVKVNAERTLSIKGTVHINSHSSRSNTPLYIIHIIGGEGDILAQLHVKKKHNIITRLFLRGMISPSNPSVVLLKLDVSDTAWGGTSYKMGQQGMYEHIELSWLCYKTLYAGDLSRFASPMHGVGNRITVSYYDRPVSSKGQFRQF